LELTNSGVNVRGFSCAGWRKGKYGVAMVLSDVEVNCAISVTSNRVKAAPLLVSLDHVKMGKIRGVVANSGNANALNFVTREIAKKIARDGEGATKTIKVKILKAANLEDARKAARTVVGSNLVKASIYGEDLNWGRIIAALGYCGAEFEPEKLSISINGFRLVDKGRVLAIPGTQEFDKAKKSLKKSEVEISVELNSGNASATAYGCDLTPEYVKINSGYTT
jgi:N-acetylglutamate synthase/N-acetylornithine aminotransferase